jgi:serine protease inhibitor
MFFLPISKDFLMFLLLSLPIEDQNNSLKSNYALKKLSQVNNDFGLTLFGLLSVNNDNDIISPFSLLSAMSINYYS